MATQPLEINTSATEVITHANAELRGRKYLFTYKRTNGGAPSAIEMAIHVSNIAGDYDQVGVGQMASGRLTFNIREDIGAAAYTEIVADALSIINQIKQS